ncbi:MAG: hypothetical protein ACRDZ8_20770 [Acidimicrobiales bacterium]
MAWRRTRVTLDFDATLVDVHSASKGRRGTGLIPMLGLSDETGETLAGMLREGAGRGLLLADHIALVGRGAGIVALPTQAR